MPTTSALARGTSGSEKSLSNEKCLVDSLPKSLRQRYKKEGDVSSQQPTFVASSMARGNDAKCVAKENCSSESSNNRGEVINADDNSNNIQAFQTSSTSLSSSNGKAESSGLPATSSYNLRHNLHSNEESRKYAKGKPLQQGD